jgi:hypothetical protein
MDLRLLGADFKHPALTPAARAATAAAAFRCLLPCHPCSLHPEAQRLQAGGCQGCGICYHSSIALLQPLLFPRQHEHHSSRQCDLWQRACLAASP